MNLSKVDLSELETYNAAIAQRLKNVIYRAVKLGAFEGAQRLAFVGKQFKKLTIEEIYHIINPDEIFHETEEAQTQKKGVGRLQVIRNGLSITPLIFTWFSLYEAATNYHNDLANPKWSDVDQYQPFLRLWQDGFHNTTWLTFSMAAGIDVILLLLYVILILGIPIWEWIVRKRVAAFFTELQSMTDELLDVVGVVGINPLTTEADVDKVIEAIKRVINRSMLNSDKLVTRAEKFITDSETRVGNLITHFNDDLATFNADLTQLTLNLTTHNTHVQDLTVASTKMADASVDLKASAHDMATSATTNAAASTAIGTQLGSLNSTQKDIVQTQKDVAKSVSDTQQDVVKAVSSAADKMDVVAIDTKQVAKELVQVTQTDVQAMTAQIAAASAEVAQFAAGLTQINAQLKTTSQSLQNAANALAGAANKRRQPQSIVQVPQPINQQQRFPPQQQQQVYPNQQMQQQQAQPPLQPQPIVTPPKKWWKFW